MPRATRFPPIDSERSSATCPGAPGPSRFRPGKGRTTAGLISTSALHPPQLAILMFGGGEICVPYFSLPHDDKAYLI